MASAPGRSAAPDRAGEPSKPGTALVLRNQPSAERSPAGAKDELADFAKDLRELRTKAGLGYPEMAELSHYTMKTLAAAAGGLALPSLPVTAAYVRACDGNVADWEDRWHRIADAMKPEGAEAGPRPGTAPDRAPGRGNGTGGRATGGTDEIRGADGTGQESGTGGASGTGQGSGTGQESGTGGASGTGQGSGTGGANGTGGADGNGTRPAGEAPGPPDQRKPSRPSQVSSPRPAHEGPSAPDLAPPPPDKRTEQVYVITSAAPRRPYR